MRDDRSGATVTLDSEVPIWKWPETLRKCFTTATAIERLVGFLSLKLRAEDLPQQNAQVVEKERLVVEFAWRGEVFADVTILSQHDGGGEIQITDRHRGVLLEAVRYRTELLEQLVGILKTHGEITLAKLKPSVEYAKLLADLTLESG